VQSGKMTLILAEKVKSVQADDESLSDEDALENRYF
jgi:hypothetical protein